MEAKPDLRARNWLGTYNNPVEDPEKWLKSLYETLKAVYVCGQVERGDKEGTRHI